MTRRHILVFGGAFNPPTLAHEAIIRECLALPQFDEVWLMPSGDRLDKQISGSDHDRLHMLRLVHEHAFRHHPRLRVSDFELRRPRPTQTFETVAALQQRHPEANFSFVFGRDSYLDMPRWPDGQRLQRELPIIMVTSGEGPQVAASNVWVLALPAAFDTISSTKARDLVARGRTAHQHLSRPVYGYVTTYELYR